MNEDKEFEECPECGSCISVINGIISRHEKKLGYMPYKLYHRIEKITGTSVKEQAKNNKCCASNKHFKEKFK